MAKDKYVDIPDKFKECPFDEFCNYMAIELGDLLNDLMHSNNVVYRGLKFRKKSVKMRRLLKFARDRSLQYEKELMKSRK